MPPENEVVQVSVLPGAWVVGEGVVIEGIVIAVFTVKVFDDENEFTVRGVPSLSVTITLNLKPLLLVGEFAMKL